MSDIFNFLKDQLNSSIFVLIVILLVLFWAIYALGKLVEKFRNMESKVDKNSEKHSSVGDDLAALKAKVDIIYLNTNPNAMVRAQSPATLTEIGEKVRAKIHADDIYDKYKDLLKEKLKKHKNENAYDIQQQAFDIATKFIIKQLDSKEIKVIKEAAFKNGVLEEDILLIFGILLRDDYMKENNIAHAEIDKHNPIKES